MSPWIEFAIHFDPRSNLVSEAIKILNVRDWCYAWRNDNSLEISTNDGFVLNENAMVILSCQMKCPNC